MVVYCALNNNNNNSGLIVIINCVCLSVSLSDILHVKNMLNLPDVSYCDLQGDCRYKFLV